MTRPEMEQYEKIKSAIERGIDVRSLPKGENRFDGTEDEIMAFVKKVIEDTVSEPALRAKMLDSLRQKWKIIPGTGKNNLGGSVGWTGDKKERIVFVGERKRPFSITRKTSLMLIRNWVHEIAHDVSQKHYDAWHKQHKPETDQSIGEIESMFMEKVFMDYIRKHKKELSDKKLFDWPKEDEYENAAVKMRAADIRFTLGRLDEGIEHPDWGRNDEKRNRYVVGEVVSEIMYRQYQDNPEGTMKTFSEFLKGNAEMTRDQAVEFVTNGKIKTYGKAIEEYEQILQKQSQR